jgi:hypothetical protein
MKSDKMTSQLKYWEKTKLQMKTKRRRKGKEEKKRGGREKERENKEGEKGFETG